MGIYMDNAATTMQKPDCVIDAVVNAMRHMGNSGRGAHEASLDASRLIYETREMLSELFNLGDPRQVAFTLNSTEALNTAILGLFDPGDHIISTVMEHNSVLRPLYRLEEKGCQVSFVPCDEKGRLRTDLLESFLKENTKALVCTHASNLTGNANDLMYLGRFCKLISLTTTLSPGCNPLNTSTYSKLESPNCILRFTSSLSELQTKSSYSPRPT